LQIFTQTCGTTPQIGWTTLGASLLARFNGTSFGITYQTLGTILGGNSAVGIANAWIGLGTRLNGLFAGATAGATLSFVPLGVLLG